MKNYWTPEQDQYIRDHWEKEDDDALAAAVGHPVPATHARRLKLGLKKCEGSRGPDWSQKEVDYIREVWGDKTIPQIARHLKRSINAVKIKAVRLGYTGQTWSGEMMSARKVSELLGVDVHTVCDIWIPKYGLKGKRRRLGAGKRTTTIIMFTDLLEWLEKNQALWDSRRLELYGLGMEYDWLHEKRRIDAGKPVRTAQKWTSEEDARMIALYKKGDKTYAEIGQELGRPASGIQHRLNRLDVWGSGKYIGDPQKSQKAAVKENFEKLCLIIRLRDILLTKRNSMEFGQYWQRSMCLQWSDTKGCTAGCDNCDDCTEFQRIQPQYCARCGATFYEREANRFCAVCRQARKKRAQRRWSRQSGAVHMAKGA